MIGRFSFRKKKGEPPGKDAGIQKVTAPPPEKWAPALRASVSDICAPLMRRYGYHA